jgi:hypothetical protein
LPANPPIRKQSLTPGPWARSNREKSNLFAEHLAEVFTPNDNIYNQEIIDFLQHDQVTEEPAIILTSKEIEKEITYLNNKKTPSLDQICAKMMQELPKKRTVMLTYIFNAALRLHSWPKHLKVAKIILVLKPGKNPNHVTSYRQSSLLTTISKFLERLIYHKINSLIDVISLHQFGFRHSHSTIQQCHRIVHILVINKSLEEKKNLSLCLFGNKPGC